jgi:predicted 3-demethylubiquinone-9 3-methyltransferase (glyoxalase superfamily)
VLGELMTNPDPAKANRVTQALMQMGKIDIATLEAARDAA